MADAFTPNFNLCQPEIGASRDSWGTKLNQNTTILDQFLGYATPVGVVLDFAGPNAPPGWLICDGRTISRTTYSALFGIIGTAWGAGDGVTTFALPNTPGRASVGPGTITDANGNTLSLSFAQSLGALSNQIAQAHLPNYALTSDVAGSHNHGGVTAPGGSHTHSTDVQGSHSHGGSYLPSHGHPGGYTDSQGLHGHYVYEVWGNTNFGANFGGGAYQGQGTGYFGGYTDNQGNHYHNLQVANAGNLGLAITTDGAHAHNITYSGNLQLGIYTDGSHSHTIYLGGSSAWFPTLAPIIVFTKIIYAGSQAAALVMATTAPTIEGVDELAAIRDELAQLRAQVGFMRNPPHPRRIAAPLRGSH